jgi:5-methylcytosine-specific restriction enzyme subunit McrC
MPAKTLSPKTLSICEHGAITIGDGSNMLTLTEREALRHLAGRTVPFFSEEWAPRSGWQVRFRELVGAVRLANGTVVEILPKVDGTEENGRSDLLHMVACAGILPSLIGDSARLASGSTIIDAYLAATSAEAWRQARRGLHRGYVDHEPQAPFIRGKWLMARQLARSPMRMDRHEIRVAELTDNNPMNRFLKAGFRVMAACATFPETSAGLRRLVQIMDGVGDVQFIAGEADRITFDRLNARWEPTVTMVRQFAARMVPYPASGNSALGVALLFDMNTLFEAFVAARMRRLVRPVPVRAQGSSKALAKDGPTGTPAFFQKPDLVIGPIGAPTLVLDTKWKRLGPTITKDVSAADIRQIFAYGKLYGADRVALLYPAGQHGARRQEFIAEGGLSITVTEIPVREGDARRADDVLLNLAFPRTSS